MKNKIFKKINRRILILLFLFPTVTFAQSRSNFYVNPMLFVGYSIGSGYSYGIDITLGLIKIQDNLNATTLAVTTKYYFVNLNGYANRVLSFNIVAENDYSRIGFGIAEIKRKWGVNNRNTNRTYGFATDFGIHAGPVQVPWLGFRTIIPLVNADWYEQITCADFYLYFRYPNIML